MIRAALLLSLLVAASQAPARPAPASTDNWPTYNGDFTGRRFSALTKINDRNGDMQAQMTLSIFFEPEGAAKVATTN